MPVVHTAVNTAEVKTSRSHIVVTANPKADAAFVDMGPVLHWWAFVGFDLDPAGARDLAAELTAWADRRVAAA